jgi:hypothetical protein
LQIWKQGPGKIAEIAISRLLEMDSSGGNRKSFRLEKEGKFDRASRTNVVLERPSRSHRETSYGGSQRQDSKGEEFKEISFRLLRLAMSMQDLPPFVNFQLIPFLLQKSMRNVEQNINTV